MFMEKGKTDFFFTLVSTFYSKDQHYNEGFSHWMSHGHRKKMAIYVNLDQQENKENHYK